MLIGNISEFAIQYELDGHSGGQWMFGRICYWIDGKAVGDYFLGVSLRDVFLQMRNIVGDEGRRSGSPLVELERVDAFHEIDACIYSMGAGAERKTDISIEFAAHYDICIPVDVFGDWKIYLIQDAEHDIFLYKQLDSSRPLSCELPLGIFERNIKKLYFDLSVLYEATLGTD